MNAAMIWLIVRAVLTVLPAIVEMVRTGQIKNEAQDEMLAKLNKKLDERVKRTQNVEVPSEDIDPNNRSR